MAIIIDGTEIVLSGMVGGSASGDSWWDPPGFNSEDVIRALAEVGREANITVRLNSGGGIATEGSAIHSALSMHKGTVQIIVEGIAASAASLIAMAADTLTMSPGSVMMIHDPAAATYGDIATHEQSIVALNALADAYAAIYSERSGKSLEECRAIMRAETWFTAEAAVGDGFADAAVPAANDNAEPAVAEWPYMAYRHAPGRLVAMAQAKGWYPRALAMAAAAAQTAEDGEDDEAKADAAEDDEAAASAAATAGDDEPDPDAKAEDDDPEATAEDDPDPADMATTAALLGAAGMSAQQIMAWKGGPEAARARAEEITEIRGIVAAAKRANPAVTMTADEAVARDLSVEQVRAILAPQIAAQEDIVPQAPPAGAAQEPASLMAQAVARLNAAFKPGRR
ncbi:MAG: Clp protease ClpP [Alsobacter sp.]